MSTRMRFVSLALSLATGFLHADTLVLHDGRVFNSLELERGVNGVVVAFENGDVTVPWRMVRECIIPGEIDYEPKNDAERKKLDDGYVFFDGRWVRPSQRDKAIEEMVEEQLERIEDFKKHSLWRNRRTEETKNFAFDYTVPQHVFENYRDLMETYYKVFEKEWKIKRPKDVGKLHISFFVDYDAFLRRTGMPNGVLGFFKFVEPFELAIYYDRNDPRGTEEVIYHEVGHYLQKLINVEFKYPHWPGESLSEYYSGSHWDNEAKSLSTGSVMEGRLSSIQLDIKEGEWVGLEEMLLRAPERTFTDYSWGWSFVHFLMNDKQHAKNFVKFYKGLAKDKKIERTKEQFTATTYLSAVSGEEVKKAFMRYMKIKNDEELKELEKQWYAYLENELKVTSTRGLEGAAWRSVRNGRRFRAKRLYEEAFANGGASALAHYRYARILSRIDDEEERAGEFYAKSLELDPLVADHYIGYGRYLLDQKGKEQKEEGKRLLKLAFELEPDNEFLIRNLDKLLED